MTPKADPTNVRVLTYNTHHGADRHEVFDMEAIAGTIDSCQPDVVALQEVDRHWSERSALLDQPAWYAERLGMAVHYAPNVVRRDQTVKGVPAEYGLAILTRIPLRAPRHQLYTGLHAESRGLVAALVSVDSPTGVQTIRVINTHLSVRDPAARRRQVNQLMAYADSQHDLPTVVAGDFNALTRARALGAMRTQYRDAWEVGLGSPATVPGRRIDYLWMSRHFQPAQTVVVRSRASDHFALVSDLAWG